jgi:methionine-S-sulfoxide reductase
MKKMTASTPTSSEGSAPPSPEIAILAGGCFWAVEDALRRLPGVVFTRVGYTGGHAANPTYEQVCTHQTGHAEAVEVTFDPTRLSYRELLVAFITQIHDPTQLNGQGPDTGNNYRSEIFYLNPDQAKVALDVLTSLQARFPNPIVTFLTPAATFWEAEAYHQHYLEKHRLQACPL